MQNTTHSICMCIYIYMYREREREIIPYIYIYIYIICLIVVTATNGVDANGAAAKGMDFTGKYKMRNGF